MCKAIGYLQQLQEIGNQVNKDYLLLIAEEIRYNNLQLDLLHYIENADLSTLEKKMQVCETLQQLRRERRKIKNEKETLEKINIFYFQFNNKFKEIMKDEKKQNNWIYAYKSEEFKKLNGAVCKSEDATNQKCITLNTFFKSLLKKII